MSISLQSGVFQIIPTSIAAFAAIKSNGSIITWGSVDTGESLEPIASFLSTSVYAVDPTDTTAPAAPSIISITDDVSPITGTVAPGGFTNDTSLDLTGTAEAASTVSIYNGSTLLGTATANGSGAWTFNTATLTNGTTYAFNATATDAAGNTSSPSANYTVTVDTTAPAAPAIISITDDVTPITGTVAPGGFTNDTSLDLTGTAEAASTVSIYNGSTLLGTTTADNTTGAWSYSATGLSNGTTYTFNATATDAAGTTSSPSANYTVTVDTTAPAAPSITSITDDVTPIIGTVAPGGFTNDTSLDLTGTAEAASTVSIYNGSTLLGTATANGTGAWSYTASGLTNGSTYTFNATATDAAGNVSEASSPNYSVTVDTTAPAAPSIISITDNVLPIIGTVAPGGASNDTSLDLTGTAEAGSTVSIYNGSTLLGTTTADNTTGAWSYSATGLSNGTTYTFNATATDAAGNVSSASSYSVTVDTTAPAAPSITSITDDVTLITGTVLSGGISNDISLDLTGTAEADSTISIYNGSTLLGAATANGTGTWSFAASGLTNGSTYTFNATATDAAGNTSSPSANYTVTIDTLVTSGPINITSDTDTGEDDTITSVGLPVVTFTGESNLVLRLIGADGSTPLNQGTQYAVSFTNGTYTVSFLDAAPQTTGLQPFGTYSNNTPTGNGTIISDGTYTINATDAAGNSGTIGSILIATDGLDNDGANDTFELNYDINNDGIKDSKQRFVATFESSTIAQGATNGNPASITVKPIEQANAVDPLTGGSLNAITSLIFRGLADTAETTTGDSITSLQTYILNNPGNDNLPAGAELVVAVTDQPRFRVIPEIVRTGTVDPAAETAFRAAVNKRFKETIQQVDLYFGNANAAWNVLFKPDGSGGYYFFGYNPTTGLGGILLDRDNNGSIDGARLYLKDNELGDLNPDDFVIDDPVGMAALASAPTLRLSDDKLGLVVDGVAGTGLWLNIAALSAAASWQNGLELRTTAGEFLGAIGATANSGNLGSKQIYLEAGKELRFAQNSGNNGLNTNPLMILSADGAGFRLRLDDAGGPDRDYNDLELSITSSLVATTVDEIAMARRQSTSADAIIDLSTIPISGAKLTLSILTDCGYINRLGLIKVEDSLTGYQVAGVAAANTDAFRQAVRDNLINPGGSAISAGGQSSRTITWDVTTADAGLYAAVLINPNGQVFTFGSSTGSDGRQHVKVLGDNTFGFEDLLASQGSDWDFNDLKVKVAYL